MTDITTVLITGSNRGIGKGFLSTFALRPAHTIVACVRDPTHPTSTALLDIPCGESSTIILLKVDSASETDPLEAVQSLKAEHGIEKLDIVIANAGISDYFGPATTTPFSQMLSHFTVNAVGPLLLFQATSCLLGAAKQPKFVAITSGAGSIGSVTNLPVQNTAYGASKAALNFVVRRIHYENPGLVAFVVNPGWLQTDLGNHAAAGAGMDAAPVKVEDGVRGVVCVIDEATREGTSGRFMNFDGMQIEW